MFTSLFVVCLIESSNQFFKNSAHAVVIQSRQLNLRFCIISVNRIRTKVDIRRNKLLNDSTKDISFDHCVNLISELELCQNFLHIRREAIKIRFKIRLQRLFLCTAGKVTQTERRSITKRLSSSIAECRPLICDTRIIQHFLHFQNCRFGILQHGIQTANNGHRQNNITILATNINISQAVVCDSPYKINNCIMHLIIHNFSFLSDLYEQLLALRHTN